MREQRTKVKTKQAFEKWWRAILKKDSLNIDNNADEIWQYFHREFPREAAAQELFRLRQEIVRTIKGAIADSKKAAKIDTRGIECLDALERLWNGGQDTKGSINLMIPSDMICDNCGQLDCKCEKPVCPTRVLNKAPLPLERMKADFGIADVCPTCGGRKTISRMVDLNAASIEPCPDCTEKPLAPEEYFCCFSPDIPENHAHTHACAVVDQRKGERRNRVRRGDAITYGRLEAIEAPSTRGRRKGDRRGR